MAEMLRSVKDNPLVSIVVLNWNGAGDTIECLKSLAAIDYPNFRVVLVDNASTDNSLEVIRQFVEKPDLTKGARHYRLSTNKKVSAGNIELKLIVNPENVGFAKGNNIGIREAHAFRSDYVLLLNNDTEVTPDFLTIMMRFALQYPEFSVLCPQIRYYNRGELIWNCGGKLTSWGAKKYFYGDQLPSTIKETEKKESGFVTGCALLASVAHFSKYGLLSEDFFFGEEDYEYSLRMQAYEIRMACVLNAVIYHKVSSSSSRASSEAMGRIFIHYLNRFINLRRFTKAWRWQLWRFNFMIYIVVMMLIRYHTGLARTWRFSRLLMKESSRLKSVNKATFETYFSYDFSGKPK